MQLVHTRIITRLGNEIGALSGHSMSPLTRPVLLGQLLDLVQHPAQIPAWPWFLFWNDWSGRRQWPDLSCQRPSAIQAVAHKTAQPVQPLRRSSFHSCLPLRFFPLVFLPLRHHRFPPSALTTDPDFAELSWFARGRTISTHPLGVVSAPHGTLSARLDPETTQDEHNPRQSRLRRQTQH